MYVHIVCVRTCVCVCMCVCVEARSHQYDGEVRGVMLKESSQLPGLGDVSSIQQLTQHHVEHHHLLQWH